MTNSFAFPGRDFTQEERDEQMRLQESRQEINNPIAPVNLVTQVEDGEEGDDTTLAQIKAEESSSSDDSSSSKSSDSSSDSDDDKKL